MTRTGRLLSGVARHLFRCCRAWLRGPRALLGPPLEFIADPEAVAVALAVLSIQVRL